MQLRWTDNHGPQTMTVADDQALTTAARLVRQQVATAVEVGQTCTIMLAPAPDRRVPGAADRRLRAPL